MTLPARFSAFPRRLLGAAALMAALGTAASAQSDFKGETISIQIGYGPGGGYDTYGRALARPLRRLRGLAEAEGRSAKTVPTGIAELDGATGTLMRPCCDVSQTQSPSRSSWASQTSPGT